MARGETFFLLSSWSVNSRSVQIDAKIAEPGSSLDAENVCGLAVKFGVGATNFNH
jgi:hypothetical protein